MKTETSQVTNLHCHESGHHLMETHSYEEWALRGPGTDIPRAIVELLHRLHRMIGQCTVLDLAVSLVVIRKAVRGNALAHHIIRQCRGRDSLRIKDPGLICSIVFRVQTLFAPAVSEVLVVRVSEKERGD